jgi:hypothetical protein
VATKATPGFTQWLTMPVILLMDLLLAEVHAVGPTRLKT